DRADRSPGRAARAGGGRADGSTRRATGLDRPRRGCSAAVGGGRAGCLGSGRGAVVGGRLGCALADGGAGDAIAGMAVVVPEEDDDQEGGADGREERAVSAECLADVADG